MGHPVAKGFDFFYLEAVFLVHGFMVLGCAITPSVVVIEVGKMHHPLIAIQGIEAEVTGVRKPLVMKLKVVIVFSGVDLHFVWKLLKDVLKDSVRVVHNGLIVHLDALNVVFVGLECGWACWLGLR